MKSVSGTPHWCRCKGKSYPTRRANRHVRGTSCAASCRIQAKSAPFSPEVKGKRGVSPTHTVSFVPHLLTIVALRLVLPSP